jgi:hypothetical protein
MTSGTMTSGGVADEPGGGPLGLDILAD